MRRIKKINHEIEINVENTHGTKSASVNLVIRTVKWVLEKNVCKQGGYINVILTNDKKIIDLNNQYLKKKTPTDVLAFDLSEDKKNWLEGEIYISLDRNESQAIEYRVTFEHELIRLVTHGVLHVLGYRDDSPEDKRIMTVWENSAIKEIGQENKQ